MRIAYLQGEPMSVALRRHSSSADLFEARFLLVPCRARSSARRGSRGLSDRALRRLLLVLLLFLVLVLSLALVLLLLVAPLALEEQVAAAVRVLVADFDVPDALEAEVIADLHADVRRLDVHDLLLLTRRAAVRVGVFLLRLPGRRAVGMLAHLPAAAAVRMARGSAVRMV